MRNGTCFKEFDGRCTNPRRDPVTGRPVQIMKAECCCSHGEAWGSDPCEPCPKEGEGKINGFSDKSILFFIFVVIDANGNIIIDPVCI